MHFTSKFLASTVNESWKFKVRTASEPPFFIRSACGCDQAIPRQRLQPVWRPSAPHEMQQSALVVAQWR